MKLLKSPIVWLFFVLAIISGFFIFSRSNKNILVAKPPLVFEKDGQLFKVFDDNKTKQLTSGDGLVYKYIQAFPSSLVAYINGEKITNPANYTYISPNDVFLLDVNTGTSESIFSLTPTDSKLNSEYQNRLWDVAFSDDKKLLAITTSDSLYIYDLSAKKLSNIFTIPFSVYDGKNPASFVFSFTNPIFSTDNSYVSLRRGYYEGASYVVVNLETKQLTNTPYSIGHGGGQIITGWISSNSFIVNDLSETFEGKDYPDLNIVEFPSLKTSTLVNTFPGGFGRFILADNTNIYGFSYRIDSEQKTNYEIEKINIKTGDMKTLSSFQTPITGNDLVRILGVYSDKLYFIEPVFISQTSIMSESMNVLDLTKSGISVLAE